ncbi:MAG: hypothetical protein DWQ30_17895, partial [Acidobacteria bacterium]
MPRGIEYSDAESRDPEMRRIVRYDPETGRASIEEGSQLPPEGNLFAPPYVPGVSAVPDRDDPEHAEAELDGLRGGTPPTPLSNATTYPWVSIVKLVMRFGNFFYNCSGFVFGEFQVVTAGHCIYNHDPNDDGSTADAAWADEVWIYPAQGDVALPAWNGGLAHSSDQPYGPSKMVFMRSYTGWTVSQNLDYDFGSITLDRRIGTYTGWMGMEATVASALNFSGYPTETPYVPSGTPLQYFGFDSGNVNGSTSFRIGLDAFIYGGHSGGPSWRFSSPNRWVEGVHSTSNRVGAAEDTRLNQTNIDNVIAWAQDDENVRPPFARPELVEYTHASGQKAISKTLVGRGEPIVVDYNNYNAGFANTGTITNRFFFSTNGIISDLDTLADTSLDAGLSPNTFRTASEAMTVPPLTAGTYYVGWISSSAVPEYSGDATCTNDPCSNVAILPTPVTVENCDADGYEDDDSSGQANLLGASTQSRSLCETGDEDWAFFNLAESSQVILQTDGPAGDTRMWLRNAGLSQIEFDDDGGPGLFSLIDRFCGVDPLPAGLYYVQIDEFGDNNIVQNYDLDLDVVACSLIEIFSDGFESGARREGGLGRQPPLADSSHALELHPDRLRPVENLHESGTR